MKKLACIALFSFLLAGCQGTDPDEQSTEKPETPPTSFAVNKKCPMEGQAPKKQFTLDFNGQRVGFCCGVCLTKWQGVPDAEKVTLLAKAR